MRVSRLIKIKIYFIIKVPRIIIYINKKTPQKATKNKTKNSKNKKKGKILTASYQVTKINDTKMNKFTLLLLINFIS